MRFVVIVGIDAAVEQRNGNRFIRPVFDNFTVNLKFCRFRRCNAKDAFSDAAVTARAAECPQQCGIDACAVIADLAIGTGGIAFCALIIFAFASVAMLPLWTIFVAFTFVEIIIKKACRTDANRASSFDALFAFVALGIAIVASFLVFARLIDANLIFCTFGTGVILLSWFADMIDAFFLSCTLGAGIFGIVTNATHAGLFWFALAAWIGWIVANAMITGLFGRTFAAWIG